MNERNTNILLIEDDATYAKLLASCLERHAAGLRFNLEVASSLKAGKVRIAGGDIDVILSDLGLPDCQGIETLKRLRKRAPDTPIIVLSGEDDPALEMAAIQEGAEEYLVKGEVERKLIVRSIRYALERRRVASELQQAQENYRSIYENTLEGIFQTSMEGKYLTANPGLARIYGYDEIPRKDAKLPQRPQPATEQLVSRERLLLLLADRGYQEAITYSFVDARTQRLLFPGRATLELANPISAELGEMRVSLWPGLIEVMRSNLRRQQDRVRLFEVGTRFEMQGGKLVESQVIAGLITGPALPEQWGADKRGADFYDLKSDVEALFGLTGRAGAISYIAAPHECLHPGRSAAVMDGNSRLGWLGQLHPETSRELEIRDPPWLFELAIDPSFRSEVPVFTDISRFPAIRRDLAVVIDESTTLDELKKAVNLAAKGLLRELHVFDVYRGAGVEAGRKSVALGLILQETSRTLTDVEADTVMAAVVAMVKGDLKASIRG